MCVIIFIYLFIYYFFIYIYLFVCFTYFTCVHAYINIIIWYMRTFPLFRWWCLIMCDLRRGFCWTFSATRLKPWGLKWLAQRQNWKHATRCQGQSGPINLIRCGWAGAGSWSSGRCRWCGGRGAGCEFQGKRDETLAARTLAFGHEVPGKVWQQCALWHESWHKLALWNFVGELFGLSSGTSSYWQLW